MERAPTPKSVQSMTEYEKLGRASAALTEALGSEIWPSVQNVADAFAAIAEAVGDAVEALAALSFYEGTINWREWIADFMQSEEWERYDLYCRLPEWLPWRVARWIARWWPVTEEQALRAQASAGHIFLWSSMLLLVLFYAQM